MKVGRALLYHLYSSKNLERRQNRKIKEEKRKIKRKEKQKMLRFTIQHKFCKCLRQIEGENVFDALKNNNLDFKFWDILDVEKIK